MFFVLSKTLGLLLHPVNFLVLLGLFGLALGLTRYRRLGHGVAITAALLFAVLCFSPLSGLILAPLENRFPPPPADMPAPAGIIVLGGSLDAGLEAARGEPTLTEAAARLTAGAALARRFPAARLVFTGGSAELGGSGLDEAQGVRRLWLSLGVPAAQMAFEDASRNTFENATMTRDLVEPKPGETWLLVTSAAHMPRSVGIFRKVGWPVTPYPTDYRTFGDARDARPNANALESLQKLTVALTNGSASPSIT